MFVDAVSDGKGQLVGYWVSDLEPRPEAARFDGFLDDGRMVLVAR